MSVSDGLSLNMEDIELEEFITDDNNDYELSGDLLLNASNLFLSPILENSSTPVLLNTTEEHLLLSLFPGLADFPTSGLPLVRQILLTLVTSACVLALIACAVRNCCCRPKEKDNSEESVAQVSVYLQIGLLSIVMLF